MVLSKILRCSTLLLREGYGLLKLPLLVLVLQNIDIL